MDGLVATAVKGAMVGWTLGKQCRSRSAFSPVSFYNPIPLKMHPSDAIESWLVWSWHLKIGRRPEELGSSLFGNWNYQEDESGFGLANIGRGLGAPLSGSFSNPLSNGSRAIGRVAFWGIVFRGKPDVAARHAFFDASIDHAGDGVWIPVACAYALATIKTGDGIKRFVDAFVYALPRESKLRSAVPLIVRGLAQVDGNRKLCDSFAESLGLADPLSAPLTGAWIIAGMVSGDGQFDRSVCECAAFGGAADHSTLVVGAASAILGGQVPDRWLTPLGDHFEYGNGLVLTDRPTDLDGFIAKVAENAMVSPVIEEAAPAVEHSPALVPLVPLDIDLTQQQDFYSSVCGDLIVSVHYLTLPCYVPGETVRLSIEFRNVSSGQIDVSPIVTAPSGWECAHKIGAFSLLAGGGTAFPMVLRCTSPTLRDEKLSINVGGGQVSVPLIAPQRWYSVGPLLNQEGTGFDRVYPAQSRIALGEVFNGRSDMPVEWRESLQGTCQFDLEALMAGGPGTAYYFAHVRFAEPGTFRLVVASSVGAIVFIDGQKVLWYHHTHTPVPRALSRYTVQFRSEGSTKILVKTFRNLEPAAPMTVYFLDATGAVVFPVEFVAF